MGLDYHCDANGLVVCSYCGQSGIDCNIWREDTLCVERRALAIARTASASVRATPHRVAWLDLFNSEVNDD